MPASLSAHPAAAGCRTVGGPQRGKEVCQGPLAGQSPRSSPQGPSEDRRRGEVLATADTPGPPSSEPPFCYCLCLEPSRLAEASAWPVMTTHPTSLPLDRPLGSGAIWPEGSIPVMARRGQHPSGRQNGWLKCGACSTFTGPRSPLPAVPPRTRGKHHIALGGAAEPRAVPCSAPASLPPGRYSS